MQASPMAQTFNANDFIAQEQLFFGLDEVRGQELQYADAPNSGAYQQVQYGQEPNTRLSTSPDFILNQAQASFFAAFESPDQFHHDNFASFIQSPLQSFNNGFNEVNSTAVDFAAWNSPPIQQTLPYHPLSSPVDIPSRSHQTQYGLLSPTSTAHTSFLSNGSWGNSSYTSNMSRTESMPGSVASFDTTVDDSMQFPKQDIVMNDLSSSPFNLIEYRADDDSHRLTQTLPPGSKRPRGRRGPLNQAQRASTAHMRNVKACASCRLRKAKCDPGIPCKQCIGYYKANLIHHPCRGKQLDDLADQLLRGHIFPRKRALGKDFGVNFRTSNDFTIYLSFGFGEPFAWPAQIASPFGEQKYPKELHHEHVVYKWTGQHKTISERTVETQLVFPALLTDTTSLKAAVDKHLGRLVNNADNFRAFPNFNSPLAVLKDIYTFYRRLNGTAGESSAAQLLGQALKLLNLIHIGGDIRVSRSQDSRQILDAFFGAHIREAEVIPCYIRSQLGEVFSKLATEYMKEVLSKLEVECLNKDCSKFAVVVSCFIVIVMSIESVQHKTQKDPFHSRHDGKLSATPASSPSDNIDGMVDLLEFYKNCFGGCHKERLLSIVDVDHHWTSSRTSSLFKAGEQFVGQLRTDIQNAKSYLMERSKEELTASDVTVFFDRLVARLLLLEP